MQKFIKNIDHETVLHLADLVQVLPGQVVSITLFAFDKDEEISSHDSQGDAMVTVLEGKGKFTVGGKEHILNAGDTMVMPAQVPHAIYGEEAFKWMLVVVFPEEK